MNDVLGYAQNFFVINRTRVLDVQRGSDNPSK